MAAKEIYEFLKEKREYEVGSYMATIMEILIESEITTLDEIERKAAFYKGGGRDARTKSNAN
jgi:hypothetical protein